MIEKTCPFMSRSEMAYVNDDGIAKFQFSPVGCREDLCMAWYDAGQCCHLIHKVKQ